MTEAQKKAIYIYRLKQKYIKVLKQRIKLEKELNDNGVWPQSTNPFEPIVMQVNKVLYGDEMHKENIDDLKSEEY